jgi:hypothetical protein
VGSQGQAKNRAVRNGWCGPHSSRTFAAVTGWGFYVPERVVTNQRIGILIVNDGNPSRLSRPVLAGTANERS